MRRILTIFFAFIALSTKAFGQDLKKQELCPHVTLICDQTLTFTSAELALICGDGKTRAWSSIPLVQAGEFLKTFLASRGYHKGIAQIEKDHLTVQSGPISMIREVHIAGESAGIDASRFWPISGVPLTSKALDDLDAWLKRELANRGMPCAETKIEADSEKGNITISFNLLIPYTFPRIETEPIFGINGEVPRRYYSFQIGDLYNIQDLELSARRLVTDDVVLSSHFITECPKESSEIIIRQQMVTGKPRLVTFGIGFDTEEYLITEATWGNARFGPSASSLKTNARASFRKQSARATFDWYYAPVITRHFLRSVLRFERQNERRYDTRTFWGDVGPGWTWDRMDHFFEAWLGGSYRHDETVRGEGSATANSFAFAADLQALQHDFEYFAATPKSGHQTNFSWRRMRKGLGSEFSATNSIVSGTYLYNLFAFDPAIWILGLRGEAFTTQFGDDTEGDEVPVSFRNFLGGSENLRGFSRKQVPADDRGALTSAYLGAEARIAHVLPYRLQPIVFVDFGRIGMEEMKLDEPVFWSPGFGINWQSPFGTLRGTLAHGFVEHRGERDYSTMSHAQFYLSFGEQF